MACAAKAAGAGLKTLVLERENEIGPKVCAGGITWNGLMRTVPAELAERSFPVQHLRSPWQRATVRSATPIIATIDRRTLGQDMAKQAVAAGAEIRTGYRLSGIDGTTLSCQMIANGNREAIHAEFVVGADGSSSLVRRSLGIPSTAVGIGITYQLPGEYPEMQWHLDAKRFGSGYAWVFPHRRSASIGGYVDSRCLSAKMLKNNLLCWAESQGYPLRQYRAEAGLINFDYRGHRFGNTFLIGDAAGLASGLTGEGIYSAILSGEAVAEILAGTGSGEKRMSGLIGNHRRHRRMVEMLNRSPRLAGMVGEIVTLALRIGLLGFTSIEMAH